MPEGEGEGGSLEKTALRLSRLPPAASPRVILRLHNGDGMLSVTSSPMQNASLRHKMEHRDASEIKYLLDKNIPEIIDALMGKLLEERPENPLAFMRQEVVCPRRYNACVI